MRFCDRYCNKWLPNSDFSTPGKGCDKCRRRDKEYKQNYKSNLQKREAEERSPSANKKLKAQRQGMEAAVVNRDRGGETPRRITVRDVAANMPSADMNHDSAGELFHPRFILWIWDADDF
jgi:hypothetical protein